MTERIINGQSTLEVVSIDGTTGLPSGGGAASGTAVASATPIGYADGSGNLVYDSDATPIPVVFNVSRGTFTDRSGTITTGGTSQQVMAANANRKALIFINASDTIMYLEFTGAATTAKMPIAVSGGSYIPAGPFISTEAINVLCATTGKAFYAKEA